MEGKEEIKKLEREAVTKANEMSTKSNSRSNRRHANFGLLTIVIFAAAVFLASAFLYHLQLGFFFNKLEDKSLELDQIESTLDAELSRLEESEETLKAKERYESDLINRFTETQETSEDLERQISLLQDTYVQRQNRAIIESNLFEECDIDREDLIKVNEELKEDLLDAFERRNEKKADLDACLES